MWQYLVLILALQYTVRVIHIGDPLMKLVYSRWVSRYMYNKVNRIWLDFSLCGILRMISKWLFVQDWEFTLQLLFLRAGKKKGKKIWKFVTFKVSESKTVLTKLKETGILVLNMQMIFMVLLVCCLGKDPFSFSVWIDTFTKTPPLPLI